MRTLLAAGWLCALSCSLVVDTSDVDEGCGPGRKLCAGQCVEQNARAYGCTPNDCDPCRLTNAIPRCEKGACVVEACLFGFGCPEENGTGCVTNILTDAKHCGSCDNACDGGKCINGKCMGGEAGAQD